MTAPARPARSGVLRLLPLGLPPSDAHWNQHHRLILAVLSLLGTSATMVELLGGATTAHFGFFVSLGFIALYQSRPVCLLAVAFTAVHHVAMALWMPMHLFAPGTPESHQPVLWALVHAVFILAGAVAQITFWRFAESSQIDAAAAEIQAKDVLAAQLLTEQAGADERAVAAREIADAVRELAARR